MAKETMEEFLDSLAARTPTPGGGAVAAITGAQAAALMSMVSAFTPNPDEITKINQRANEARKIFLQLVQQDIDAFEKLMSAYKLKKGTEDRESIVQSALTEAAEAPRAMMLLANSLIEDASRLQKDGNQNLITDTAMAAVLLEATIKSAEYNILINLKSIKSDQYKQEIHADMKRCRLNLAHLTEIAERIRRSMASDSC